MGYVKYGSGPSWGFVDIKGCSDAEATGAEAILRADQPTMVYSSLDSL